MCSSPKTASAPNLVTDDGLIGLCLMTVLTCDLYLMLSFTAENLSRPDVTAQVSKRESWKGIVKRKRPRREVYEQVDLVAQERKSK